MEQPVDEPAFAVRPGEPLAGTLFYDRPHQSFHFEADSLADVASRSGDGGVASLSIDTLLIEVGVNTRQVLVITGYRPTARWKRRSVTAPPSEPGVVTVQSDHRLKRGVSYFLGAWSTDVDASNSWVELSAPTQTRADQHIEVATGIVLGINCGRLIRLWLQPIFTDAL